MPEGKPVELATGEGPLGTGVYLLRLRQGADGQLEADSWALLAFVPLLPLGRVRLTQEEGRRYLELSAGRPASADVAAVYARGAAGLSFVLASFAMAYNSVAFSSWFAGLGVLFGGGLPLLLLGWLDQTLRRRRVVRGRASPAP